MNISACRACAVRPCTHDWESHARHLAAELALAQERIDELVHMTYVEGVSVLTASRAYHLTAKRNEAAITRVREWEAQRVWDYFPCVQACSEHKAATARLHELFLRALDGSTE